MDMRRVSAVCQVSMPCRWLPHRLMIACLRVGVMMTLADGGSGSNILKVAGPETVPQYLASCRTFVQR